MATPHRSPTQHPLLVRSLRTLEFDKVLEHLSTHASFSMSKEAALSLTPSFSRDEVLRLQRETLDALRLLQLRPDFALQDVHDIRLLLHTASIGGLIESVDLITIADTLAAIHSTRAILLRMEHDLRTLGGMGKLLGDFREGETIIKRTVNRQGQVLDSASPLLARLRGEERTTHSRLQTRLREMVSNPETRRLLQEPFLTTRDDRYVLAVKAEFRGQLQGIIHDISSSGATVFMEPIAIVEMGNAWRELKLAEQREVQRVLREVSAIVGARAQEITTSLELLTHIDLAIAKARYGAAVKGVCHDFTQPPQAGRAHTVRLMSARHPLLKGDVVPITVEIGKDFQALLISGPNTGGKTVALKTIGLLALMGQAGIPIPAAQGSSMHVFDGVYADIGDEQSIAQSLSTFSGHLKNIVEILKLATSRSLVMLDELGAGTDPQEGSAIARAILMSLVRRGATSVVTTHHSELKTMANATPGVRNASVDFDPVTLAPTYRLVIGLPGRSNALAIAERLGLPRDVLKEARSSLGPAAAQMDTLLQEIQAERKKIEENQAAIERARRELEETRADTERRLAELEKERLRGTLHHKVEVQVQAEELRSRLRHAARRLNSLVGDKGRKELAELTAEVEEIKRAIAQEQWKTDAVEKTAVAEAISPGDLVRIQGFDTPAEVVGGPDQRGRYEVQAGPVRIHVTRSRILFKEQRPPPEPKRPINVLKGVEKRAIVGDELWVHGMRAQQAVETVNEYIEKAALAGHSTVRIIHGKGQGILRKAIQRALGDHPLVGVFRDGGHGEGGEGVTIVDL
jgi:DNA mismatch repair protein MutS2